MNLNRAAHIQIFTIMLIWNTTLGFAAERLNDLCIPIDPDGNPLEDELVEIIDQMNAPLQNLLTISHYSAFREQK